MACILPEAGHPDQMENGSCSSCVLRVTGILTPSFDVQCSMLGVQFKDLVDTDFTDFIDEHITEFKSM